MNEPLQWERVPTTSTDFGVETYRSLIDGQGWMILMVRDDGNGPLPFASYFVPDPNGKWGVETEKVERKTRWD